MQNKTRILALISAFVIIGASVFLAGSLFLPKGTETALLEAPHPEVGIEPPLSIADSTLSGAENNKMSEAEATDKAAADGIRPDTLITGDSEGFVLSVKPERSVSGETAAPAAKSAPAAKPRPVSPPAHSVRKESRKAYWVQLASFSSEVKAREERERLGSYGIPVYLETVRHDDGAAYRLRVGAWRSREEAVKFRDKIRTAENEYREAFVTESAMLQFVKY
jgi:cell division septation protein DedD